MRNAPDDVVTGGGQVAALLMDATTVAQTLVDCWAQAAEPAAPVTDR